MPPTAAVASIAFAPEIAIPTIRAFRARFGEHLYQKYGFLDAVNPSFTWADVPLRHGRVIENIGWVADDYQEQQFRGPVHCADPTLDGLVYVCDRQNNRVPELRSRYEQLFAELRNLERRASDYEETRELASRWVGFVQRERERRELLASAASS